MGVEKFLLLLLAVTGGSCSGFFNVLHPTSYDCDNATGGQVSQHEIFFDPDMFLDAGGYMTVVVEMHVKRLATLKFYICPNEIPKQLRDPWKFDCSNRKQLDVTKDYQSAILDQKLQYYYDVTFINVKIPSDIGCNRCGLQIVAEFKMTPNSPPYDIQTVCAFIHIEYNKDNRAVLILAPIKIYQPQLSLAPPKRLPNQSGMPLKTAKKQHRKTKKGGTGHKGKPPTDRRTETAPTITDAPINKTLTTPEPKPNRPRPPHKPHKLNRPHKPHKAGRKNNKKNRKSHGKNRHH